MLDWVITSLIYDTVILLIYSNVRKKQMTLLEIVLTILVIFIADHGWFYFIVIKFLFLILLSYFGDENRELSIVVHIFYGIFPFVLESALKRLVVFFIMSIFSVNYMVMSNSLPLFFIVELLVLMIYFLLVNLSKVNFQDFIKMTEVTKLRRVLIFTNVTMIFYNIVIEFLTGAEFEGQVPTLLYRQWLTVIYFFFFIFMLFYLNRSYQTWLEHEIVLGKEKQLQALSDYSKQMESLYQEVRGFRHDYINILTSLKEGIDRDDMAMVKKTYETVLEESGYFFNDSKFEISHLSNIENDAIKSILSTKMLEAHSLGIDISVEVQNLIGAPDISLLDYVRLLSILCDNAIEAAIKAEHPQIKIAYFDQDDSYTFVIENTTKDERIPVDLIFKKNYSSKGIGRGVGLTTVNHMVTTYSNLTIQTSSKNHLFRQTVHIKKGPRR